MILKTDIMAKLHNDTDNSDDDSTDYTEDSFDKFLSNEESDLLKDK